MFILIINIITLDLYIVRHTDPHISISFLVKNPWLASASLGNGRLNKRHGPPQTLGEDSGHVQIDVVTISGG